MRLASWPSSWISKHPKEGGSSTSASLLTQQLSGYYTYKTENQAFIYLYTPSLCSWIAKAAFGVSTPLSACWALIRCSSGSWVPVDFRGKNPVLIPDWAAYRGWMPCCRACSLRQPHSPQFCWASWTWLSVVLGSENWSCRSIPTQGSGCCSLRAAVCWRRARGCDRLSRIFRLVGSWIICWGGPWAWMCCKFCW